VRSENRRQRERKRRKRERKEGKENAKKKRNANGKKVKATKTESSTGYRRGTGEEYRRRNAPPARHSASEGTRVVAPPGLRTGAQTRCTGCPPHYCAKKKNKHCKSMKKSASQRKKKRDSAKAKRIKNKRKKKLKKAYALAIPLQPRRS
jgi:hypothetical protein